MSPPLVVFDLDGTLIDTAPDLVDTLNLILGREGLPPIPFAEARNMIGGGTRVLLERALVRRDCGAAKAERLYRDFLDHYSEHIADRSRPFPGLETALDRLDERGCRLAVCTNKLERLSIRLLDILGLRHRFAVVCGQDTFGVQKPDPQILLRTIQLAGGDPRRAVMVGDSVNDVNTARAAEVPVVAVAFGYTDVPVALLGPDRVIDDYQRLPKAVFDLIAVKNAQVRA